MNRDDVEGFLNQADELVHRLEIAAQNMLDAARQMENAASTMSSAASRNSDAAGTMYAATHQ